MVGTPLYMAPQILKREKYTSKCDVWSMGVLFYQVLTVVIVDDVWVPALDWALRVRIGHSDSISTPKLPEGDSYRTQDFELLRGVFTANRVEEVQLAIDLRPSHL